MIQADGHGGQVQFDGQYVTITRSGFLARATHGKGEKRLHISQISAVQWKPAGAMVNGFIQFTVPGGNEARGGFGQQTMSAAKDENSVIFTRKQQPQFDQLRYAIDQAVAAQHAPSPAVDHPTPAPSMVDELSKLANLFEQGLISREDYDLAKKRLLGT